jgi:hypothetical protein
LQSYAAKTVFARGHYRHFRIAGVPLSHAESLTLISRSVAWHWENGQ